MKSMYKPNISATGRLASTHRRRGIGYCWISTVEQGARTGGSGADREGSERVVPRHRCLRPRRAGRHRDNQTASGRSARSHRRRRHHDLSPGQRGVLLLAQSREPAELHGSSRRSPGDRPFPLALGGSRAARRARRMGCGNHQRHSSVAALVEIGRTLRRDQRRLRAVQACRRARDTRPGKAAIRSAGGQAGRDRGLARSAKTRNIRLRRICAGSSSCSRAARLRPARIVRRRRASGCAAASMRRRRQEISVRFR